MASRPVVAIAILIFIINMLCCGDAVVILPRYKKDLILPRYKKNNGDGKTNCCKKGKRSSQKPKSSISSEQLTLDNGQVSCIKLKEFDLLLCKLRYSKAEKLVI